MVAFAPAPTILPTTETLFDAWALTSIRTKMPGRPIVEPYLHGIRDYEPPETQVAWRDEVDLIVGDLIDAYPPQELLDDYPLKPHELLRDRSDRVFRNLELLAKQHADKPIWIVDDAGTVVVTSLEKLADKQHKDRINGCTILLPPSAGGLARGMLDGTSEQADDVADIPSSPTGARIRVWSNDSEYENKTAKMRRVRTIEFDNADDEEESRRWEWFESLPLEGGRTARKPVLWETHVNDVLQSVRRIVTALSLPAELAAAIIFAAELHDHGKRRQRFQLTLGNRRYPDVCWAKSGRGGARLPEPFRHEFASLLDAQGHAEFSKLSAEMQDVVLHLIATHHGRGRPHFDLNEAFDSERPVSEAEAMASETPRRFARLQRKFGRWGLAYLESVLRAADWAASAAPSAFADEPEGQR
jgi:CRISPR-associated endonuclease/helicase Cas3